MFKPQIVEFFRELFSIAPWLYLQVGLLLTLVVGFALTILAPAVSFQVAIWRGRDDRVADTDSWRVADWTADAYWNAVRYAFLLGVAVSLIALGWHAHAISVSAEVALKVPHRVAVGIALATGAVSYRGWMLVRHPSTKELENPEFAAAYETAKRLKEDFTSKRTM